MKVPYFDLKTQCASIEPAIKKAFYAVYRDAAFSGGRYVEIFEKKFRRYIGTKYVLGVANGTAALHLALLALKIGPKDEVIIPANTFIATAWAASYVGAVPVFADCDKNTWEIDPVDIKRKISKRTRAIIGVHLYGQPFNLEAVKKIAKKNSLFLIEDCAQAQGALYKNKMVGTFGDIGCFSFYPSKNLGAYGEAGAITTNNKSFSERIARLRNHGSTVAYQHDEIGFNYRMDGLQGAFLTEKLRILNRWNTKRQSVAKMYRQKIKNKKITFQLLPDKTNSVYHLFVVAVKERDALKKYLDQNGIGYGTHYPIPCHLQKAYRFLGYKRGDCPNAEYLAKHCLSLPMFPELTKIQIMRVINILNNY